MSAYITLPVTMRAAPSLDTTSGTDYYRYSNGTNVNMTGVALDIVSTKVAAIYKGSLSLTQGQAGMFFGLHSSSYLAFSSEL